MSARLFREGDTLIGHFADGVRWARVTWLSMHGDALCFVDRAGRDLGPLVGGFTTCGRWADPPADALEA